MDSDKKLEEFLQVLGHIRDLVGEEAISGDTGIDLVDAIEQLRRSGNNDDADALTQLVKQAEALKAQHQTQS